MKSRLSLILVLIWSMSALSPGFAGAAVLPAIDRGWFNETGRHASSVQNTITGFLEFFPPGEYRSYFTFDFSSLTVPLSAVTLRLEVEGYWTSDALESATIWDVSPSNVPLLDADYSSGSPIGQSIFADLGSGATYGSFSFPTPGNTLTEFPTGTHILDISLNSAAIADMNTALGEQFAIGLSLDEFEPPTGVTDEWIRFSFDVETRTHELVTTPIPLPTVVWLFGSGLLGLIGIARTKKAA